VPTGLGQTFTTQPANGAVTFLNADGTTAKAVYTGSTGPFHVTAILLTNSDSVARVIDILLRIGATNYLVGSVSIPAGAGLAGAVPKEFFEALNLVNLVGVDAGATNAIWAAMEATITSPNVVTVSVIASSY
jgi:hypothetical protein